MRRPRGSLRILAGWFDYGRTMSTTHPQNSDVSAELAALKRLVDKLLRLAQRDDEESQTIPEFCASEKISRAFFYELMKAGRGPRTMRHADGCVRISPEARRDWRREREAASTTINPANTRIPIARVGDRDFSRS